MGIGGISIWQLLIILAIVVMLFGTKRLRNIGSDLGGAIKGFKSAMDDESEKPEAVEKQNAEKVEDDLTAAKSEEKTKS